MAKETASYISQLVATNPVASDSVSVGDDHLRMLKTVLKTQFSGLSGTTAVTASEAEMNYLDIATLGTSADSKVLTQASGVVTIAGDVKITGTTPLLTIGDAGAEDTTILFDGNAKDFYVALDDSADKLLIGEGSTVGTNPILSITDDTVTLGDGAAVDTAIVFDGNAKDFYVGLDDSADKLVIGVDSTVGTNSILTLTDDTVTLGDGAAVDTTMLFDGNALNFHVALDDSADDLVIGTGDTAGTNTIVSINGDASEVQLKVPTVTVGDGTAEDTIVKFDGNAADFRIGIDDGTDKLEIGGGTSHGTAAGISMDVNGDMTLGGGIVCSDDVISRPELKDYAESYTASAGSGTVTLDLTNGNVFQHTASGGNVEFAFSNPPGTGKGGSFTLKWIQDSSNRTITWPASVDWAGGSAPSVTSGSAKVDVYTFFTVDGGTIWYGFQPGADLG